MPSSPRTLAYSCGSMTAAPVPCGTTARAKSGIVSMDLSTWQWPSIRLACRNPLFMQRIAMGIYRDDHGKICHLEFPNGFGRSEFVQEVNVPHFPDALGQHLRRPADSVQVNAAVLSACFERFVAHAA